MDNLPVEPNTIADIVVKAGSFLGWLIFPGLMKKRRINEGKAHVDVAIEVESYREIQQREADILAKFEGFLPEAATSTERAISSFFADAQFSQRNREQIGLLALKMLESTGNPLPEENALSEELMVRFYRYASDISTEEAQRIWAKLLAEEIANPGSFSLNTLDTLRNLTSEQARSVVNISKYIFGKGILLQYDSEKSVAADPASHADNFWTKGVKIVYKRFPNWDHINLDFDKINFLGLIAPKRDYVESTLQPGILYDFKLCSGHISIQVNVDWVRSFFYLPLSDTYFEILSLQDNLAYDDSFIYDIVEDLNSWGASADIILNKKDLLHKKRQEGGTRGLKYFF